MSKKSQSPISIRLTEEVAEKFREHSQNYANSQSEFIEILLKRFDETKDLYPTDKNESNKEREIWVYTSYLNLYKKDKQYKEMKKYLVCGHSEYFYPDANIHYSLNEGYYLCCDKLKKEFDIQEDISKCKFCYWFWILWDSNQDKFLLLEKFSILEPTKNNTDICKLYVDRCKHFDDMRQIRECISKFSMPTQLLQFDRQYAEKITSEELREYWI